MELTKEELIELRNKVEQIKEAGEIEKILEYKSPYQRFKEVATRKPDSIALNYFGNKITYQQMLTYIDHAANGFNEIGIKYNDVVTASLLATPYGIIAFYALDKIGATMHMVNTASSAEELERELKNFESNFFIATDVLYSKRNSQIIKSANIDKIVLTSLTDTLPLALNSDKLKLTLVEKIKGINKKQYDSKNLISFEQLLDIGRNSDKKLDEQLVDPHKLSVIAYTSGSTGNCKACRATTGDIDAMIQIMGMTEIGRFSKEDVMFSTFPLWINYSLINMIHEPLSLGVTLALDPIFDPKDIIKRNKQYKFNHWLTIPPYIKTMVELNKKMDCSRWKIVVTGGDALDVSLKLKADEYIKKNGGTVKVEQGYGANELLGSVSYGYYKNPTPGSVGKPCIGNMVKIIDIDTNEELGSNKTGVAYFYSAAVMEGYHNDEEATKTSLIPDNNGVYWYNTEDLMHQNEQGELFMDGRIRRIALTLDKNNNPTKIIPERTKKAILQMPEIDNCEVITVKDEKKVNKAVAFIVIKHNQNANIIKQKVFETCQKNVPEYMVPREIYIVDSIPQTSTKKPNIQFLEKQYVELSNSTNYKIKTKRLTKK